MMCELCGQRPAEFNTEVEGTTMSVCQTCTRYGDVKGKSNVKIVVQERKRVEVKEPEYVFVQGYGAKLKQAREKLGLKQDEFAKKLNERESVLHQIESEHFKPSIALAKKLEHALNIHILDEIKSEEEASMASAEKRQPHRTSGPLTIGDMLNIKK